MKRFFYALAAAALLLCSCEKEISFIGQYEGRKLVLYACANPDTTLSVQLHTSKFILDSSNVSIFDPIRGATVTGRVGGREIIFHQEEDKRGAYISDYIPSVSDKIELFASSEGFDDISATAVVPKPADFSIDSYSVKAIDEGSNWTRYKISAKVTLRDDPSERNFYRITFLRKWYGHWEADTPITNDVIFRDNGTDIEDLAGFVEGDTEIYLEGLIDDSMMEGRACQFEIWIEDWIVPEGGLYYAGLGGESSSMPPADFDPTRYAVEIDTASEDTYKYCQSVASYNMYDDFVGLFGEPVSIHNNIIGGIGCFSALTPRIIPLEEQ